MTRRALIIQSGYDPLAGFANSARCIAQVLRGFELAHCVGPRATRAGILEALDALTTSAEAGDAVVVYYVGHGGLTINGSYTPDAADLPRYIQNLCPTDYAETTEDAFHGISSFELSLRLAALTRKTTNVTMILECCYAARLARGDLPGTVRVSPKITRVGLTRHLQALRDESRRFSALELTGNPNAIRVAACGQTEAALQVTVPVAATQAALGLDLPEGGWINAMTLRLAEILAELGDARVSWRSIASELRRRLVIQQPEIEGPLARVPFTLDTIDATTFPVRLDGRVAVVEAGQLLGVSIDDVYGVMPAGSSQIDPAKLLAELTIDDVSATRSWSRRIAWRRGAHEVPTQAVAIASSLAFPRCAVRVVATGAASAIAIAEAALQGSTRVRAAAPDEDDVLAELRIHGDQLVLHDAFAPLFSPARFPERLRDAVRDLENLATERRLRALPGDEGLAPDRVEATLLVVGPHGRRALASSGEAIGLDDPVALVLVNRTAAPLYANVFNIGLRRRFERLSADTLGIRLDPGTPTYVGDAIDGPLVGFTPAWPESVPRDQPRTDTVLVAVTTEPVDLSTLETKDHLGVPRANRPPLIALLEQLATGRSRNAGETRTPASFALCWRDYQLFPLDASLDIGAPQLDASPPGAPRPCAGATTLTLRLEEIAAAPGTRIDVLVCARSATMAYHATTRSNDGSTELLAWIGELRGAADVYVWTSTATGVRRTLAELLARHGVAAPADLLRAPDGDPRAALAAGASLQLAAIARSVLREIAPEVVTAFRGSFGAGDRSGQRYQAEAVSFTLAIEELAG